MMKFKDMTLCFSQSGFCFKFDIYLKATSAISVIFLLKLELWKPFLLMFQRLMCILRQLFLVVLSFRFTFSAVFNFFSQWDWIEYPIHAGAFSCDKKIMKKMQQREYEAKFVYRMKVLQSESHDAICDQAIYHAHMDWVNQYKIQYQLSRQEVVLASYHTFHWCWRWSTVGF